MYASAHTQSSSCNPAIGCAVNYAKLHVAISLFDARAHTRLCTPLSCNDDFSWVPRDLCAQVHFYAYVIYDSRTLWGGSDLCTCALFVRVGVDGRKIFAIPTVCTPYCHVFILLHAARITSYTTTQSTPISICHIANINFCRHARAHTGRTGGQCVCILYRLLKHTSAQM
jgi:hypothetical protein